MLSEVSSGGGAWAGTGGGGGETLDEFNLKLLEKPGRKSGCLSYLPPCPGKRSYTHIRTSALEPRFIFGKAEDLPRSQELCRACDLTSDVPVAKPSVDVVRVSWPKTALSASRDRCVEPRLFFSAPEQESRPDHYTYLDCFVAIRMGRVWTLLIVSCFGLVFYHDKPTAAQGLHRFEGTRLASELEESPYEKSNSSSQHPVRPGGTLSADGHSGAGAGEPPFCVGLARSSARQVEDTGSYGSPRNETLLVRPLLREPPQQGGLLPRVWWDAAVLHSYAWTTSLATADTQAAVPQDQTTAFTQTKEWWWRQLSDLPQPAAAPTIALPKTAGGSMAEASEEGELLGALLAHLGDSSTLPTALAERVQVFQSANARSTGKLLHKQVARQTEARTQLQRLAKDRQTFLEGWAEYLQVLTETVDQQGRLARPSLDILTPSGKRRLLPFCKLPRLANTGYGSWIRYDKGAHAARALEDMQQAATPFAANLFPGRDPSLLPTLIQLEDLFRGAKQGKAPGPNGIPEWLWALDSRAAARAFLPIFLKAHFRLTEPVQFKSTALIALFKGKGSPAVLANHRAIALLDGPGKALRRSLRPALVSLLPPPDQQQGGTPGSLLAGARHLSRAHQQLALGLKTPTVALFLDVSSAYYRVLRQSFGQGDLEHDEDIAKLLTLLKVPPSTLQEVCDWLSATDLLTEASPHCTALICGTFFHIQGAPGIVRTRAGSRPGDSIADLLFSLVQADFLQAVRARIGGLAASDPVLASLELPINSVIPVWADDAVVLLAQRTTPQLLQAAKHTLEAVHGEYTRRAMAPNYAPGKSEALFSFKGLGLFYVTSRTALLNRPCMPPAPFALPFAKPKQMSCILDMGRSGMTTVPQMACPIMGISSASSARQPLPPLSSYRPIALASMASAALQPAMLFPDLPCPQQRGELFAGGLGVQDFSGGPGTVSSCDVDWQKCRAFTGSRHGQITLWDLDFREALWTLPGHKGLVQAVSLEPGGNRCLSLTEELVCLWTTDGALVRRLPGAAAGEGDGPTSAIVDWPCLWLLTAGPDSFVRVWDLAPQKEPGEKATPLVEVKDSSAGHAYGVVCCAAEWANAVGFN
ncbi:DAW1 [Symbiodinium pilosum]|uniref:DAW1 protein n=1 Tax=Symbiodinium pilosum TaxID=2952 RepID=A0A812RWC1_SYMPI|nr:DAW1 [Symbiodinium pilosum]